MKNIYVVVKYENGKDFIIEAYTLFKNAREAKNLYNDELKKQGKYSHIKEHFYTKRIILLS